MKYRIISMDFDGTLLTSNKKVSEENEKTLLDYKSNGYLIVGITARNFSSVNDVCDINIFDYLILNNGSYIYDVKNKSKTNYGHIENEDIVSLTNYFDDIADEVDYCSLNVYYKHKKISLSKKKYIVEINNISEIKETIVRMNIFLNDNENIDTHLNFINNKFSKLNAFEMSDTDNSNSKKWLAINPKEIDKFKALEKLCLKLNINIGEVIFFGDGANDLPIISKVGLGVAMGNALQEVKEKAQKVTLSNDQNGIASFLKSMEV